MDKSQLKKKYGLIGESAVFSNALEKMLQVAPTDITVLLNGETGVGKDITARAIHDQSLRKSKPLVIVNCGAIPEGIIESELFGHEKGAYTGAHESRMGYFEQANGGSIFLDEIADTPKNVQVKLLRILETGEFFRVGSSKARTTDVRVIAATNKDLWKNVETGDFREDLFYRLNTVTIRIPPLRERGEDILLIFHSFVSELAQKYDSVFRGMSDGARKLLLSYRWPGNIRELRNVAEQLVVLEKSQFIDEDVLRKYLKGRQKLGSADNLPMLFETESNEGEPKNSFARSNETQFLYRILLDMKSDMNDLKKMLGTLLYNTYRSGRSPRSLPEAGSSNTGISDYENSDTSESKDTDSGMPDMSDTEFERQREKLNDQSIENKDIRNSIESGILSDIDFDDVPGDEMTGKPGRLHDLNEESAGRAQLSEDQRNAVELFGKEELPSLVDVEKFLIRQALNKYNGNRRKAARILGMSERTLYRKIDQYELL
ncbi:MAG: sigma 54-interacting transcriptional regulator [Balneolales bacterium]